MTSSTGLNGSLPMVEKTSGADPALSFEIFEKKRGAADIAKHSAGVHDSLMMDRDPGMSGAGITSWSNDGRLFASSRNDNQFHVSHEQFS
jgi:hypothetical protein